MDLASGIKTNVYGMVLNTGINVVTNILVSRYCLAADFGVFNFVISNLAILLLAVSLGMDSSISYTLVQKNIAKERLVSFILLVLPALLLVVLLLLYFFRFSTGFFDERLLLLFSLLFVAGNFCLSFFLPFYQAEGLYKQTTVMGFIFNSCLCLLAGAFLLLDDTHGHLKLFALLYAVVFFIYGLSVCAKPLTQFMRSGFPLPSKSALKPFFKYAVSALLANVLFLLVYRVDFWFVNAYCTESDLGNYIQASKLGQLFLLVPTFIATPVFFASDAAMQRDPLHAVARICRWIFVANLLFIAIAALLGYYFFEILYGPTFDKLFVCFLGLAAGIVALSVNRIICAFWARTGFVRFNILGNSIALLVIVLFDALFIKSYGVLAAAFISSGGYILFLMFNLLMLKRKHNIRVLSFFKPQRSDMVFLKTRFLKGV